MKTIASFRSLRSSAIRAVGVLTLLCAVSGWSATYTWNGAGANNNCSNPTNWVGGAIVAGNNDYVFGATSAIGTNINWDFSGGANPRSITFSSGAPTYNITGNTVQLITVGIDEVANSSSSPQTLNLTSGGYLQVFFNGTKNFNANAGNLTISGVQFRPDGMTSGQTNLLNLYGSANGTILNTVADNATWGAGLYRSLQKSGTGTWTINGAVSHGGGVTVTAGTLQLNATCAYPSNTLVSGGTLILNGPGSASTGVLKAGTGLTISSGATVQMNKADEIGYGAGAINITNNGGTITTLGGSSFRVTMPPLVFTGGTLTAGAGNNGDVGGNYLLGLGASTTVITVNTASSAVLVNPPAGVSIYAGTTLSVARGTAAADLVFSSPIINWTAQTGSITKSGTGIAVFNGTNTYTGTTTISGGKLLQAAAATGGGAYSVSDGATLGVEVITAGNTLGLSALTLGSSAGATNEFDFFGSAASTSVAAMTVTNALTVAGTSKINIVTAPLTAGNYPLIKYGSQAGAGTLTLGTVPARSSVTLSNDTVGKVYYLVVGASDLALSWGGAVSTNWDTTTLNWTNATSLPTNYVDYAAVTFNDNATTNNVGLNSTFSPGSVTVNTSTKNYNFSGAGKLTGITGLTKSGSTTLTLNTTGPNDFSGAVAVNGGTLSLNNGSQITGASGISVASSSTLNFANNNTYPAIPVTINGTGASGSHGALDFNAGNNWTTTYLGPIALVGNAQIGAYGGATVASPNVLNLPGAITGNYNLTFWGQGAATTHWQQINLSSAGNTWGGSTTLGNLAAGTIVRLVGGDNRLPTNTTVNLNATWFSGACTSEIDLNGNNQTIAGLNGSANNGTSVGNNIVQNSGSGPVNLTVTGSASSTYNGVLGASGAANFNLIKGGTGSFTLGNANLFSGSVTVNGGGNLILNHINAAQYASGITVASGSALQPNLASGTYASVPLTITGSGPASFQGALYFNQGGTATVTWPGAIMLGSGGATIHSFGVAYNVTFSSAIGGTGPLTLAGRGGSVTAHTSTFYLNAQNNYSGNTTMQNDDGLLEFKTVLGINNALPPTTALSINGLGTGHLTTLDLSGYNQSLSGLSNSGSNTNRIVNSSGTASMLTISNASASSFSGWLGDASGNNFALVKLGAGTLTLSGVNGYTGTTTISNGTLSVGADSNLGAVPGSFTPASILLSGATLQGNASFTLNAYRGITLGPTNLAGSGTIDVTAGANVSYGGVITNGGTGIPSLTKVDTGTFTLTGPNAFGGTIFVNGGTLALSGSGSLSNAPSIYVNTNGTLDVSALTTPFSLTGSQSLAGFGTVTGAVTVVAGTILQPGTNLIAGTMSFSNSLTLNGNNLAYAFSTNTTAGGGTNSLIQMSGGTLTLSGTVTIQPQLLYGPLANGTYTLVQGAGSIVGGPSNLHLNLATRQTVTFDTTSVAGSVLMIVGGAVPASLVWAGNNGSAWDTTTTLNWSNGVTSDYFYTLDNVIFDDTAATGNVALAGVESPGSVTFSNLATPYTLTGGSIAGAAGGLTLNGAGTVNLNNTNTYTGPTLINAGTLKAGAANALSASSTITISNGTLNLQTFNQSVGAVTLVDGNLSGSGAVIVASSFLMQTGAVSAVLGGAATLTKTSGGTVTLTGANTNTGATIINAGTLVAGAANALSANSAITVSNATLNIQGNNQSAGAITLVSGTLAGSGGTLTAPSFLVQTGIVTAILGGSTAPLTKSTAGTVILDGNNTFNGGTTLGAGTLQVGNNDTAGTLGAGTVNVTNTGTTIAFNRTDSLTVNNTIQNANAAGTVGSGGAPNLVINSGSVTLGGSADNANAAATVNNGGALILGKTSSSGVHALGSGLTLNAGGLLQLGGSGGDQINNSVTATMNGGTFDLAGQSETIGSFVGYGIITNSGAAATVTAGGGTGGNSAGAVFASGGTLSLQAGTVTVGGTWNNTFGVAGGATFNQTSGTMNSGSYFAVGNPSGSGIAYMTVSGGSFNSTAELLCGFRQPANLTVSGNANLSLNYLSWGDGTTYNVNMALNGGTIAMTRFNDRGSSPAVVSFNGSLLQAKSTQTGFMTAAANLTANVSTNGALFDSQTYNITISAPLLHDPALGATADGGLAKQAGSGALILSGTNTYTGNTIVNVGTLALSGGGSIATTPVLTIATNAIFDVSAVTGPSYTNPSGRTLAFNIDKTSGNLKQGQLAIGGINLTYGGPLTVTATGDALASGDSFQLVTSTGGTFSGWFSSVSVPALAAGISWDTNKLATTGVLDIYNFSTTPLAFSTATNTPTVITAYKMGLQATSGRGTPMAVSASTPTHGTASVTSGALTYTSTDSFVGDDNFTVTYSDGHGSQTMAVTVTLTAANVGPALNGVDDGNGHYKITTSGMALTTYDVQAQTTDSNVTGDWTTISTTTSAANGVVSWTDSEPINAHQMRLYRLKQH